MNASHAFDAAIALTSLGAGRFTGATVPAYANMVGPFGGVTAATALNAVLQHPERLGDPVALTVNFCAALADGSFTVTARPARTNRSTQHWVVELQQSDARGEPATVLTATAVTATRRDTWGQDDIAPPPVPDPDAIGKPNMAALVEWVKRYDMRIAEGRIPTEWDGREQPSGTLLWMRDEPTRALDFASLTAMADVFFPRVWLRRATRVPAGTVSMTVYFHAGAAQLADTGTRWLLGQSRGQGFRNGFFDQAAQVWNQAGVLLATTHQVVYYKE
jgi:acyl-CoA thioesterase